MNTIQDAITYLEGSIEKVTYLKMVVEKSTNAIEKTKHSDTLYVVLIDTTDYIIDNNLREMELESANQDSFLDKLKLSNFEKKIGELIVGLKTKL